MDRQGISVTMEFLIGTIIILATIAVILFGLYSSGRLLSNEFDMRLCQFTLTAQDIISLNKQNAIAEVNSPLKINCKRRILDVSDTKTVASFETSRKKIPIPVYVPTGTEGKFRTEFSYDTLDQQRVDSILAESMRRCWQVGLDGKKTIFNDQGLFRENTCLICDQITFDIGGKTLGGARNPILGTYLSTTSMPNAAKPATYREYLFTPTELPGQEYSTTSGGTECLEEYDIDLNPEITSGTYATILFRSFSTVKTGCMNTYVVPASRLTSLCDYIAN